MFRTTFFFVVAVTVLITNSDRAFAETTDTASAKADIAERLDAITNRLDAIEHQLAKKAPLTSGAKLPGPLVKLAVELIEQIDERVHLEERLSLEIKTTQGFRPPPFESRHTMAKMRNNNLRALRTIAAIQSLVEK